MAPQPQPHRPPPPWEGQPYSIKKHGVTITNCDSEPVQTPGCIQAHGTLLVLRQADLVILQASENTEAFFGKAPEALLGQPLGTALPSELHDRIRQCLEVEQVERNPLYATSFQPEGGLAELDVILHTVDGLLVVEFEPVQGAPTLVRDYYSLVKSAVAQLQSARTVQSFSQILTEEVRALTGLDRVMVYKFHADFHGEVFAESRRADLDPWLGLHYPAEDIPKPARDIFKQIWVRPVPDISGSLAELVPLVNPETGKPLTMTHCVLRGASVMYTEYLKNMKVTAALTMPIRPGSELWGLIACHHYGGVYPVPFQLRAGCELLAQISSLLIGKIAERETLVYQLKLEGVHQQVLSRAAATGDLSRLIDGEPNMRDGLSAGGTALRYQDRWWTTGNTPNEQQLDALAGWLRSRPEFYTEYRPIYATDCLAQDYPPAEEFAAVGSGLVCFPIGLIQGSMMMWFRPETIQTVHWAGNPHEKPTVVGPHGPRLTPRASFELFKESVRHRSLPWSTSEIEAVSRLRLLIMNIVVGHAEQLASVNAELVQSNEELDAFAYVASHDLKEPLRGIYKYAHQLLDESTVSSEESRQKIERMMRLTVRMDSLLDSLLHYSRVGRMGLQFEQVDLNDLVEEAKEMASVLIAAKPTEISVPRRLPEAWCDAIRCREIILNLLTNALKYNDKEKREVEIGYLDKDAPRRSGWPDEQDGVGIFYVKDNGIGIEPRHYSQLFHMFRRLHGRDDFGGGTGAGLTIVKKLVERHQGQIWLESKKGQGTIFYFTLPIRPGMEARS